MAQKEEYGNALYALPDVLQAYLNWTMPAVDASWQPDTVEDAQIVCGMLANNLNTIFQHMEGLPLVQMLLHAGTHNPILRDMHLTGVKFVGKDLHDFTILAPEDGASYPPLDLSCAVDITSGIDDLITVQVTVDKTAHTLTLVEGETTKYEALVNLAAGDYTAEFSARFSAGDTDEYRVDRSVAFHVL